MMRLCGVSSPKNRHSGLGGDVRRANQTNDFEPGAGSEHLDAPPQYTMPQAIVFDAGPQPVNVANSAWQRWQRELALIGGRSPLLHFDDTPRTRIELGTTHPGGLAQFITGKTTLLSNLIRDDVALRSAKVAAGLIAAKGLELASTRGIDSIHLGIGIAEWSFDGEDFRAPVLLRPLAIRRHGRDFEVRLRGRAFLNPQFARALDEQFSLRLDAEAFVALTDDDGTFKPNPVIDRLRGLTSHLDDFRVSPRLVVSSFADVAPGLVRDARDLEHPVLDALAGNPTAKWTVEESFTEVQPMPADLRPPQTDTLLLDADSEQEHVIAQIAAGNSLVVHTLPGTGSTQTIVNAIGALVGQNKRVLVVGARRASLHGIAQRLGDIGLPGLAVTPSTLRKDIIRSISRSEKAKQPHVAEVDDALVRLRTVLMDYRGALAKPDPVLGVSVLDCVTELSRLALLPRPPATTARLSRQTVEALAAGRERAREVMVAAANLGEFKYGPNDSPWYGAQFLSSESAARAHALARRLWSHDVPALIDAGSRLIATTHMRPFNSIHELGIYLRLLVDLRDTLDKFQPVVFDRSINELIIAESPKRETPEMSPANRKRLRKLAREYLRPGVHVGDMKAALERVRDQRILWQRFAAEGSTPTVPVGLAEVMQAFEHVDLSLASLDEPLGSFTSDTALSHQPLQQLIATLQGLAADSEVLNNLQERAALMTELRELQLQPLITDLANRHVPEQQVAAELELAWWRSALESLLESERALLGANTSVLDRLEADFRLVDEAHAAGSAQLLAWQLAENWKIGIMDWPDEAELLKRLLRGTDFTAYDLQTSAPHLSRAVAPVWLASPYEVPDVADTLPFDAVILVDAGATTLAENVCAIRRGRQVIAFGDPVTQTPSEFTVAIAGEAGTEKLLRSDDDDAVLEALHADSALARLGELLPSYSLTRSYRPGGEELAELVNRRFYGGRIDSLPWAGSYLGHGSLALEYVENGTGMPDNFTGAVESVDAEVNRVVELVLDHAANKARESLMVITASQLHAVRVQQAVLSAVATRPELSDFIIGDRAEPFTVATIDQAVAESRDRVIFSIGFGRTPHGRVLTNFGILGEPGGERLLAVAMTRARRSMAIVSCFQPSDIDESRMSHGAVALAEILAEVSARLDDQPVPDDSDPMLVDLARRLEAKGIRVALGHRGKLALVASHGGRCAAIETDAMLAKGSLRESLRMRPELLRRLGWHYLRVHVFELFSDPDAVAKRIVTLLGADAQPITEQLATVGARA
jgi:hypothetical protein